MYSNGEIPCVSGIADNFFHHLTGSLVISSLVLGLLLSSASCQHELNCKFQKVGWDDIVRQAFTCTGQNLNFTNPKTKITSINGQLPDGETFDNVNTFLIFEQNCWYFPVGISDFFKKLEGLAIQKSGLKKITKSDLKPFTQLKSLSLYGNQLISLESRLFIFNQKLQLISLFSNKVEHIHPNVFDGLDSLDRVFITFNPCINQNADAREKIEQIKVVMIESCPITENMAEFSVLEDENFKLASELKKSEENLHAVTRTMLRAQNQIEKLEEDFNAQGMSNESYHCVTNLRHCEVENLDLKELVKEMKIVEIFCDDDNQKGKCVTAKLKILNPQISVTSVRRKDKSALNLNQIFEMSIENQQVLHLPLNLSDFLPNLKKISLTESGLITIDKKAFKGLNLLTEINLSMNKLTKIRSTDFEHVRNLAKLDLSFNDIIEIELKSFYRLQSIKELRIDNNRLTKIPVGMISENKNLELLTLNSNKLIEIASNFLDFSGKNLRMVDLTENVCVNEKFPDSPAANIQEALFNCSVEMDIECKFEQNEQYICFAKNLEITSENMKLVGLKGEHIKNKTNVDVVVLRINKQTMEYIPASLGNVVPNLQSFCVESSELKIIKQKDFAGLENLTELAIRNNKLMQINGDSFDSLSKLETLDLSRNLISTLGENFVKNIRSLHTLNLSHNKLTSLRAALIPPNNSIKQLICSHNLLSIIDPQVIKRLQLALVVDFEDNKCIDSKYDKSANQHKKLMEIFGEISFKCTDA